MTTMAEPPIMPLSAVAGKPKAAHPPGCCASMAADRMGPDAFPDAFPGSSTDQSRL